MKIQSFLYGSKIIMSQGPHGAQQDYMSCDTFGSEKALTCKAPFTGKMCRLFDRGTPNEGFHFIADNGLDMIFVHAKYTGDKRVNQGDLLAVSASMHFHVAIRSKNVWYPFYNFLDKSNPIVWESNLKVILDITTLPFYKDMNIDGSINKSTEMVKLQNPINIKTTNTTALNVRETPSVSATVVNEIKTSTEFATDVVAQGDSVGGNTTWYGVLNGFVSGAFVEELPVDCSVQDQKITQLEKQVADLTLVLQASKLETEYFKSELEKLKISLADCQVNQPPDTIKYHIDRIIKIIFNKP